MKTQTFKAIGTFSDKPRKNETAKSYTKTFGPFTERRSAEACVVQMASQASCQHAEIEVIETESPDVITT